MPEIFINGQPVQAREDQTVLQVALENGFFVPYFCWAAPIALISRSDAASPLACVMICRLLA